ncbi:MAG: 1,4-dihydroxy-2-naphthoate octaprenyltransferase [Actinomycetia bacterium]|nr:1,4-dihydroxy-2-naphthoate octaprenyltransferase [Actinomycetes bacterium]
MKFVGLWIRAARAPFFQAAIIPVIVGTAVAFYKTGVFYFGYFIIALFANALINGGTNFSNDYFDHLSKNDAVNKNPTPFSGGSRVIQENLLNPKTVIIAGLTCFILASTLGIYLVFTRGITLLWIGLVGIFIGFFYTSPPLKFSYRGLGELAVFTALGPLSVLGSYFVQTQTLSIEAFLASIPVGLLVAGILYVNEFPDYEPDKSVGKNHLIVLLGRKNASKGYIVLISLIYLSILIPVVMNILPLTFLLAAITIPIAVKAVKVTLNNYNKIEEIIPAMAAQIQLHLMIGLLLTIGLVVGKFINI